MGGTRADMARLWHGVRMRRCLASADADAPARAVTLPAAWDDVAAAGLAALAPGGGAVSLASLAEPFLAALGPAATEAHRLLLAQCAAPEPAAWSGAGETGMRLHLAAVAPDDTADLADAVAAAAGIARALWPQRRPRLRLTGLAGRLAAAGLDYDSTPARDQAATWLRAIRTAAPEARVGIAPADAIDALLGAETAGLAPAWGPLSEAGGLSRASLAWLAARGLGPAAALAAALGGADVLPVASLASHAAMHAALAPLLDEAPAPPLPLPAPPPRAGRRDLPARHGGLAHKATVGGQKVFLRTGEYPDGAPGELAISLPQAAPATRTLVECLCHAIGIGLQHGAPLSAYVEALIGTRVGPGGIVEGDPAVARAASAIDYAMRRLAQTYLPGLALPPVAVEPDEAPLLPLELAPETPPRRRGLRVVA